MVSGSEQQVLFDELLPSWSHLTEHRFTGAYSTENVVRMVERSPSLKSLYFGVFERSFAQAVTPDVIEKLAALNRPLTLNITQWWGVKANRAKREELIRRYPHIKVVMRTEVWEYS